MVYSLVDCCIVETLGRFGCVQLHNPRIVEGAAWERYENNAVAAAAWRTPAAVEVAAVVIVEWRLPVARGGGKMRTKMI